MYAPQGALPPMPTAPPPAMPQPAAQPSAAQIASSVPPRAPSALSAPSPAPQAKRPPGAAGPRLGMGEALGDDDLDLEGALRLMIEASGSDLHITTGAPPTIRVDGRLIPLEGFPVLTPDRIQRSIYAILTQRQREQFEEHLELDFAHAVRGVARFRVNLYQQRDSLGAAFRVIPYEIKPLEELGVPTIVGNFAGLPRGLVLVTGPTGSGKSTTLAAVIDLANRTRNDHIMTVEDPIEFLHRHKRSLVNQREVGADTHSFAAALKHVLRQDPDIILVGELRDLETISVALTAAETGHLVFGTLHTQDAAQTVDRIIDVFPAHQQDQVRTQLAGGLQGVVCQALCKRANGRGRVVATEVLIATPAVRNLIREGKTHQIYSAMQAGAGLGMHTMDQHLAELVKAGKITYEAGMEKCHHVEDFNRLTGRMARMNQGGSALNSMSADGSVGPQAGL
jgi:twitching motility protein PilT